MAVDSTIGQGVADGQGAYDLTAIEPSAGLLLRVSATGWMEAESGTFDLQPGGREVLPEIVLRRGGELAGRMVDARGVPVPRCVVRALAPGEPRLGGAQVHTREDGIFSVTGLRGETYKLLFEAAGFVEAVKEGVLLTEGQRIDLGDIPLSRLPAPKRGL